MVPYNKINEGRQGSGSRTAMASEMLFFVRFFFFHFDELDQRGYEMQNKWHLGYHSS